MKKDCLTSWIIHLELKFSRDILLSHQTWILCWLIRPFAVLDAALKTKIDPSWGSNWRRAFCDQETSPSRPFFKSSAFPCASLKRTLKSIYLKNWDAPKTRAYALPDDMRAEREARKTGFWSSPSKHQLQTTVVRLDDVRKERCRIFTWSAKLSN